MGRRLLQLIAAVVVCSALPMLVGGCVPGAGTVVTAPVKQGAKEIAQVAEKRAVAEATEKAARETASRVMAREKIAAVTAREEARLLAAGQPLGRGHTGRWEPDNLREKLAMDQVMANPARGLILADNVGNSLWHEDGWVKMAQNIEGIEIHYVFNPATGAFDDVKIK